MSTALMKSLKKHLHEFLKEADKELAGVMKELVEEKEEPVKSPYGKFIKESDTHVHVATFTNGCLISVVQDGRRKHSEFVSFANGEKKEETK